MSNDSWKFCFHSSGAEPGCAACWYGTAERLAVDNQELRRQLRFANERNHERNLQLDALHFVWCDGGCSRGVHRWTDEEVTEELVAEAERNTARLRRWLNSRNFRRTWLPQESGGSR